METPAATTTRCSREFSKAIIRKFIQFGAKTKFSCIAEIGESTRQRIEFSTNRTQKEYNAGKEQNSVVYFLFAKQVKPRKRPNATLSKGCVHKRSNASAPAHRETVVMLQKRDSDPLKQMVALGQPRITNANTFFRKKNHDFVPMCRSFRRKRVHVVSSRGKRACGTTILRVTLNPGEYELLSSVEPGKKEYKLWMFFR